VNRAEQAALTAACEIISPERAEQMHEILKWNHGGCLMRERPKIADVSATERQAVRAVWDTIPDGSSSWMTAFYRILNHHKPGE
jgi:hypothetical protein